MRREKKFNIFDVSIFSLTILIISGVFLMPKNIQAQIIINEINWNGTETSSNDEWLELYNLNTTTDILLDNWTLSWNNTEINLTGLTINTNDFLLLERTDDDTIPEIPADLIYTGSLRNSGENLILKSNNDTIYQVDFSTGWPEINYINSTLQRSCDNLNIWQNATNSPKQINTICKQTNSDDNSDDNNNQTNTSSTKIFTITGQNCSYNNIWDCRNDNIEIFSDYISSSLNTNVNFSSSTKDNIDIITSDHSSTNMTIFIFYLTKKVLGLAKNWLFFGNF